METNSVQVVLVEEKSKWTNVKGGDVRELATYWQPGASFEEATDPDALAILPCALGSGRSPGG